MVKRVFYVEKEKFLRSLFETALRAKKIEIHTVESLQDNLYLLEDLRPTLIILDLETAELTPGLVGKVFAFKDVQPEVKIIGTGALDMKDSFGHCLDGFLPKPIEVSQLASKILALL